MFQIPKRLSRLEVTSFRTQLYPKVSTSVILNELSDQIRRRNDKHCHVMIISDESLWSSVIRQCPGRLANLEQVLALASGR